MSETTQDAFASPLGDRRERPVRCRRCGRETWALRAICPGHETNEAETKENQR